MSLTGVIVVSPAATPRSRDSAATQQIANRPLILHAIDALAAAGARELGVVSARAAMDEIRDCIDGAGPAVMPITYLPTRGRGDMLAALKAVAPLVGDRPAVVHRSDGLLGQPLGPLTDLLEGRPADLTLLIHQCEHERDRLGPAVQKLLGVSQLAGSRTQLALAGVCVFGPGGLRQAARATRAPGAEGDLIGIAEDLAGRSRTVEASVVPSWRCYAGDPRDLLELNRIVLDQQVQPAEPLDRGDNRIEGRVAIHPTAEVTSSVLVGPSIIGARARVSNSYIGPYTAIGDDAEIEGAEIVRSIVAEGARIMHIDERIEGSTIGRGANVVRDFALPRALRLHVGERVHVALN